MALVYSFYFLMLITFDKSNKSSVLTILLGLVGVAAGIFLLVRPGITATVIALLIAIWAIVAVHAQIKMRFTFFTLRD